MNEEGEKRGEAGKLEWPRSRQRIYRCVFWIIMTSVVAATGAGVFLAWQRLTFDRTAASAYRRIKTAVFNTSADRSAPDRFVFWNYQGPLQYPPPLRSLSIDEEIHASIFQQLRRRRHGRPVAVTRIEVFHSAGGTIYRYTQVNGKVLEQRIKRAWQWPWAKENKTA